MQNIIAGIIRVYEPKTDNDISVKFGGPELPAGRNKVTPVIDAPKPVDNTNTEDQYLRKLLDNTLVEKVLKAISAATLSYVSLERILELETQGENSSFSPRGPVVDHINDLMNRVSGVGRVGQIADKEEIRVAHK